MLAQLRVTGLAGLDDRFDQLGQERAVDAQHTAMAGEHESYIRKVIGTEELRFGRTIDAGLNILTGMMGRLKEAHEKVLSGVEAFKLNDTFGFPLDLTREIAAEAGFAVDEAAFHIEMTKQRERARAERLAKDISG